MNNSELKPVYDRLHSQGSSSWFGQGDQERALILKMGEPWAGLNVFEIGCGEGKLSYLMMELGADLIGIDFSTVAINRAKEKEGPGLSFVCGNYREIRHPKFDRLVLQGVLEHLDDPFTELKWMMDNLLAEKGDVITSSPCFLNPRGIVWMTLDMLGAVMSKTDLHFLNPWTFQGWCEKQEYGFDVMYCDDDWGSGERMIDDLQQRLPLALKDGNIPINSEKFVNFMTWLYSMKNYDRFYCYGATAVYRISK